MQTLILFFIFLTFFLIIFNAWYTAYRVSKQTKQALNEFDLQLRRRLDLIAELIGEVSKYVKKNNLNEVFSGIVKKVNTASLSEISEIITKEVNDVLALALKMAKKYPKLISSSKFKAIKSELDKIDEKIVYAKEAYYKNVEFLQKWMGKFPFKRFKEWHFDVDKEQKKMESKKVLEEQEECWTENDINDFVASFRKKKNIKKPKKSLIKTKEGRKKVGKVKK
ncbi:MAG: LemA family protein [Candidatus Paceibacterota bacterium]